jgi:hypothetical protein
METGRWALAVIGAAIILAGGMVWSSHLLQPPEWTAVAVPNSVGSGYVIQFNNRNGQTWFLAGAEKTKVNTGK